MKKNIIYMRKTIKTYSVQLYNWIIIMLDKRTLSLHKQPPLNGIKIVYAALVLALSAGAAFSGHSLWGKKTADKKGNEKKEIASVEDDSYRLGFRPETGVNASRGGVSHSERYLLARVIEGEAADEPMKGKVAVGAVIINRTESKDFPSDISQVVYQPLAFEAVSNGQYNRPLTQESLKAADLALEGNDPTSGALYYWNPAKATSGWVWQRPVTMQIGRHVFAR